MLSRKGMRGTCLVVMVVVMGMTVVRGDSADLYAVQCAKVRMFMGKAGEKADVCWIKCVVEPVA